MVMVGLKLVAERSRIAFGFRWKMTVRELRRNNVSICFSRLFAAIVRVLLAVRD